MVALVDNPTGADVAAFVGRTDESFIDGQANLAVDLARSAASAYTRGVGFENSEQIPASLRFVILQRAVRLANNAQQLLAEGRDGVTMNYGAAAQGWTTHEVLALDEYRRKVASF